MKNIYKQHEAELLTKELKHDLMFDVRFLGGMAIGLLQLATATRVGNGNARTVGISVHIDSLLAVFD